MINDQAQLEDSGQEPLDFFEEETPANGEVALDDEAETAVTKNTESEIQELDETEAEEARVQAKTSKSDDANDKDGKLVIIDDPYIAGQCTTRVTLVISPNDDHEKGPLVFIAAGTHEDLPGTFLTCRWNDLALPPQILEVIRAAHETLSQRGEQKQSAIQLAAQKKREADEKEQQRKQKKQVQAKKDIEKKKAEEKRTHEPQITDMFAALT